MTRHFQILFASLVAVGLLSQLSYAQGTASAPSTAHMIDSSTSTVWMGGPNDPINGPSPQPIDLDPTGLPWRKAISAGNNGYGGEVIHIRETIQNVGTEPWTDWHEMLVDVSPFAMVWLGVTDMRINGTSIGYTATISGPTLDLDNFSQPVLPGDVLEIDKEIDSLTDPFVTAGTPVANILQYPTSMIPEPSTILLSGLALASFGAMRRKSR